MNPHILTTSGVLPTADAFPPAVADANSIPQVDDPRVDELVATIDATVLQARENQAKFTDVWRATFSLPYWYFLVQQDDQGQHSLYVGTVGGRPHIAGFTTAQRLRNFAIRDLGVYREEQIVPSAVMTPRGFVSTAEQYGVYGIDGVAFDHNINGHYTAVTNLKALWAHCFGEPFES